MKFNLFDTIDNEKVLEIIVIKGDRMCEIKPVVYNNNFSHVHEDLMIIRTKWLTFYLNYMCYRIPLKSVDDIYIGMSKDILEMLNHEISYRNLSGGSYKIVVSET